MWKHLTTATVPCILSLALGVACSKPADSSGSAGKSPPAAKPAAQPSVSPPPAAPAALTPAAQQLQALVVAVDACAPGTCRAEDELLAAAHDAATIDLIAIMPSAKTVRAQTVIVQHLGARSDDIVVDVLAPLLTNPDRGLRQAAQNAIASQGKERGIARLAQLLDNHDESDTLHGEVPEILARSPTAAATKAALPQLHTMASTDRQGVGRMNAVAAIALIEGEAAIPFLAERAEKDDYYMVRKQIAESLKPFRTNPRAAEILAKLAADPDGLVSKAAKAAQG